ncbi:MAG: hypothetical protein MRERV_7c062 [Mycoplasmataceae bacterium RV_VA103A]|nr:MAG: hypothetical protein MRERV_7c062 [Mycoplasmataceae bacterium RV_VA103A]
MIVRIINWKLIKNENLSKIMNLSCSNHSRWTLGSYLNQDQWLKIDWNDYQEIIQEESKVLTLHEGEGTYQKVIKEYRPEVQEVNFDFKPWEGKEIIFQVNLPKKDKLNANIKKEEAKVKIIGTTLRQQLADKLRTTREQVQEGFEKERHYQELKLLEECQKETARLNESNAELLRLLITTKWEKEKLREIIGQAQVAAQKLEQAQIQVPSKGNS